MSKMFQGLNHVAIFVRNREEAVNFYTEILGGELLFTVDNKSDGLLIAMVQMDGFCIELWSRLPAKKMRKQRPWQRKIILRFVWTISTGRLSISKKRALP